MLMPHFNGALVSLMRMLCRGNADNLGYADDGEEFVGVVDELKAGQCRYLCFNDFSIMY